MTAALVLGTVQFGLSYGIANATGQVSAAEISCILASARDAGLTQLDTAVAYGQSEARLGAAGVADWDIITKLPPLPAEIEDVGAWAMELVDQSLRTLGVSCLKAVLLHRPADLNGPRGADLLSALHAIVKTGRARKVGVSIYTPDELDGLPVSDFQLVQAPFSIFDRRLATSGWLSRLKAGGVEIHVRSIFLQGLLLMPAERRPDWLSEWAPLFSTWDNWLADTGLDPMQACLGFALGQPGIDGVVVGVDSLAQANEIFAHSVQASAVRPPDSLVAHGDLLNPATWPKR